MPTSQVKPFDIPKQHGVGGVQAGCGQRRCPGSGRADPRRVRGRSEEQSLQDLESDELGVLLPTPGAGRCEIPKPHGGGVRLLGVPTVADRVAQTVVAMHLEERAEPRFHPDSYGYRPEEVRPRCGRGVPTAVLEEGLGHRPRCRRSSSIRCRGTSSIKAVEAVTDTPWVLLYVKRWLAAPLQRPRWHPCGAGQGNSAGIGGFADPGEPVHALCVRQLAGPEVPGLPVRALCRRCCRALCEQEAGRSRACRDRRADGRGGPQAPPGQDADRLLQRRQAPGRPRAHLLHLPRVHLPGHGRPKGAGTGATSLGFLPAMSTEALKAKSAELRAMRIHRRTT